LFFPEAAGTKEARRRVLVVKSSNRLRFLSTEFDYFRAFYLHMTNFAELNVLFQQ